MIGPPATTGGPVAVRGTVAAASAAGRNGAPLRDGAAQGWVSQARMRFSQAKIFGTSTYSSGVCAISEIPGP